MILTEKSELLASFVSNIYKVANVFFLKEIKFLSKIFHTGKNIKEAESIKTKNFFKFSKRIAKIVEFFSDQVFKI